MVLGFRCTIVFVFSINALAVYYMIHTKGDKTSGMLVFDLDSNYQQALAHMSLWTSCNFLSLSFFFFKVEIVV